MQHFRNLAVWQRSHELVFRIYEISRTFPKEELFGLTSQMRRSAASIPANLAEGCGRTQPEFAHFVQIVFGSASELEYHVLLARDLRYIGPSDFGLFNNDVQEIKRMLSGLGTKIRRATSKM